MEKPAQLGVRLNNLFQVMEKLHTRSAKKQTPEDLHQLRYTSSKILSLVNSQEKFNRDLIVKHSSHLEQLMAILETSTDATVLLNILHLLVELVGKAQTGKRASPLVNHGVTNILFQVLVREWKEPCPNEELLLCIHQLLSRIGNKDRKFGLKARLNQAMPVTMGMLKNNCSNFRVLNYLLNVLKLYSLNSVNSSYLGKQNVIPYLFKTMSSSGKKHTVVLKLAIDTLVNLTKSKSNSARTIGQDGIRILLSMHYDWHQFDCKHRHIGLRKAILNVLKNVTNLKSGRKSFVDADGIKILYESCQEAGDHREVESLILTASLIMRKCCPKNKLPLDDIKSPINYALPVSDYYIADTCHNTCMANTGDKMTAYAVNEAGACAMVIYSGRDPQDDSDRSSVDEDDDIDSDDDRFKNENSNGEEDAVETDLDPLYRRMPDDLRMYERFFTELTEFQDYVQCSEPVDSAIVIPTAPSDCSDQEPRTADGDLRMPPSGRRDYAQTSKQNLSKASTSSGSSKRSTTPTSESEFLPECSFMSSERRVLGPSFNRYTSEAGLWTPDSSPGCASAINLKTGSSVINFDVPSNKSAQLPKNGAQKRLQKGVKGNKKSVAVKEKDKKGKKSQSDPSWYSGPDFLDALSITPLPSPHEAPNNGDVMSDSGREDDSDVCTTLNDPQLYSELSEQTCSTSQFKKLAYPDLHGCQPVPFKEPLFHRKFGVQRQKIFEDIDRMIHSDQLLDRVVYDLDRSVVATEGIECRDTDDMDTSWCINTDEDRIGMPENEDSVLRFNSEFECGNLRKAIQVREFEYDLILNPDVNTNHHHQWFYFEVSNMIAGVPYRFNIINCEKLNSQFNFGMKPVVYSVTEAMDGRPYWTRQGSEICYYRNHFLRSSAATGGLKGKSYFTSTFTLTFQHDRDVCYLAYHYPYTYTSLQVHIANWESRYDSKKIFYRRQTLCETVGGNDIPVLTITSLPHTTDRDGIEEFRQRPYVFLSARVHPGESNSSWVMKGTVDFLLSDRPLAKAARDMFIFKVVPMLNPDGVINGCHRCSLTAEDLNRRWLFPCPTFHPSIYHTKGLLLFLALINRAPLVFCDYHGHSRRKNVFLYGCSAKTSWLQDDRNNPACTGNRIEDNAFKVLPRYLHAIAPAFSFPNCCFLVEKIKESTARVVVWRQIGVLRSYTMESTYCGCDQGLYKDQHITTYQMEEMGRKFCEGLVRLGRNQPVTDSTVTHLDQSNASNMGVGSYDEKSEDTTLPDGAEAFSDNDVDSDNDDSDDTDEDEEGTPDDIDDESLFDAIDNL